LEKANPCFRDRHLESLYPGYLLCQDTFQVGTLKAIGRVYLQAVVDTYGSFAFGKLYTSKLPETTVDLLYDQVLPFYEAQGLPVEHVLTDNVLTQKSNTRPETEIPPWLPEDSSTASQWLPLCSGNPSDHSDTRSKVAFTVLKREWVPSGRSGHYLRGQGCLHGLR